MIMAVGYIIHDYVQFDSPCNIIIIIQSCMYYGSRQKICLAGVVVVVILCILPAAAKLIRTRELANNHRDS